MNHHSRFRTVGETGARAQAARLPAVFNSRCAGLLALFLATSFAGTGLAAPAEADVRRDAVVEAVEQVLPSVVNIGTRTRLERRGWYYDWWRDNWAPFSQELPPQESAGSGLIIDEAGYVLTNSHVVDGVTEIWVSLEDEILQADIVGIDPNKDIALLKLRAKPGQRFTAAKFAKDDDLLLGETVLALGNPFGLGGSVSRGILSSKPRRELPERGSRLQLPDWLQTDASINPGNSGGPLINLHGEVIGLNVAILREGQGIGFAIPIKRVSEALAEIYTPENLHGLWFGARVKAGRLPLRVLDVQPGSPAHAAGLRAGDVIVDLNDRPPRSLIDLVDALAATAKRPPANLTIQRDGQLKRLSVRLAPETEVFNAELIRRKLGLTLQALTPALADQLGLGLREGLLIADVERGSPAATARLQAGDVLRALDGRAVNDVVSAAKLLYARSPGQPVRLSVYVQRATLFFVQRGTQEVVVEVR
jgi:S1-C subfamily serine protease